MPVPVNSSSSRPPATDWPLSSAVWLPWQLSPISPPAIAASPALLRNGTSAACCAGHTVLLFPNVAFSRFFSLV